MLPNQTVMHIAYERPCPCCQHVKVAGIGRDEHRSMPVPVSCPFARVLADIYLAFK